MEKGYSPSNTESESPLLQVLEKQTGLIGKELSKIDSEIGIHNNTILEKVKVDQGENYNGSEESN